MKRPESSGPAYPSQPGVRQRIGEDPARFLSRRTSFDPRPRIRGIDDLGVANAWLQVARDIDCPQKYREAVERRRDHLVTKESGG